MSTSTHLEETASPRYGAPKSRGTVIHAGRAIAVVFYVTVAARLLSIVSQVLTASAFGAGPNMDAYTVALIVPTTISGILTAAVGAALIPVFVDYRENKGEAESMRLLWAAMTLGMLIALAVTVALVAGAPVVALESTVIAHGLPRPHNLDTALEMESAVRDAGATSTACRKPLWRSSMTDMVVKIEVNSTTSITMPG